MGYIKVDIPAIKKYFDDNALSYKDVCTRIGRSRFYISACAATGKMSSYTYDLLIRELGVSRDAFIPKDTHKETPQDAPKVQTAAGGGDLYTLGLDVSPDRVVLRMCFQGTEIYRSASRVKGKRELDLMQAVSYAAHMMYKFAEQKELDKEGSHA